MQKRIKRLTITIAAMCAIALFAVYCTQFNFDHPLDPDTKHTLMVNSNLSAGGTVSPLGTSTRSGGDEVVVTATAAAGYAFTGWSGAVSSTASSVIILMDGNKTLTANFALAYTLTVNRNPAAGGTVTVNGFTYTSPTTHNSGASVTVRATPSLGYAFTGWSGASSSTDSEITVTMSDNWALTANFTQTFTVTYDGNGSTGGEVPVYAESPYLSGSTVTVLDAELERVYYTLNGWNTAANGHGISFDAGETFSINSDVTFYAQWTLDPASIMPFTDLRDDRTYNIVAIGNNVWMAENLNYVDGSWSYNNSTASSLPSGARGSWCYGNNTSNCNTYGRLYTWDAARTACPTGWRLPTQQDWGALVSSVGSNAGVKLKASSPAWDGTDEFGFSALPGGGRWGDGNFDSVGYWGYWWSATEYGSASAYGRGMKSGYANAEGWYNKRLGFSVRCLRD